MPHHTLHRPVALWYERPRLPFHAVQPRGGPTMDDPQRIKRWMWLLDHGTQDERIEAEMRDGYFATRADREALNADWSVIDAEGWPD